MSDSQKIAEHRCQCANCWHPTDVRRESYELEVREHWVNSGKGYISGQTLSCGIEPGRRVRITVEEI